jgi:hypothetical protein
MILRQSPTKQQGLMLTLCGALSALLMGCISSGKRTIQAERPKRMMTCRERFEISEDKVVVHGRLRSAGKEWVRELTVTPGQLFEANGTNTFETWTLKELRKDGATFDVRGRYYTCYDPFAILLGIPSALSHWTILVRPGEANAGSTTTQTTF